MKKILLILLVACFSVVAIAQDNHTKGTGWKKVSTKQNVRDSAYYAKHVYFNGEVTFKNAQEYSTIAPLNSDTLNLFFNVGGGAATDTACFRNAYIMASFDSFVSDTIIVDKLKVTLQGTSPDVDIQLYFDDNLADATPTAVFTNSLTVTSTTTGNETSTITNGTIPPGKKCWFKLTERTTQPTYMTGTLYYHKQNRKY